MMHESDKLLLEVWREACRHIDIQEATERIAGILQPALPIGAVLVRQIDSSRNVVETVAVGAATSSRPPVGARAPLTDTQTAAVLKWCRNGEMALCTAGGKWPSAVAAAVPPMANEAIVGPLRLRDERFGLVVFVAAGNATFDESQRQLAQQLLEAFSVALDNDHRLREMAALREAAEAEKQTLLAKLGRRQLGDTVVGVDSGLRAVMERVELVARNDVPVLIFGETGSGKELVARAIHQRSRCAAGPFIRVNCGAIPSELIDSQLFGHERGAFTGATEARKGWFERADGGTLLLDEIGELPPAAQVRLLRIVQDGWLERVGGHQPINVNVRIVAATHRDLAAMVAAGRFREDLWYRLAVFPIVLPPLRERRDDIPPLARHFAQRAATRFSLAPVMPTLDDLRLLTAYAWPGNVRELAAVIDRAAILGDGRRLEIATALGVAPIPQAGPEHQSTSPKPPDAVLPLSDVIRQHIEAALRTTDGRIEGPHGAAKLLAVNPHTLRGKMRKLKIDWRMFRQ